MKTALIYLSDARTDTTRLKNFLVDRNYLDQKILAVLTETAGEKIFVPDLTDVQKTRPNFPPSLDAIQPQKVNGFVWNFVDTVFILSTTDFNAVFNLFVTLGVAPRKIILWNEDFSPSVVHFRDSDGTLVVCFEGLEFHIKEKTLLDFSNQTLDRFRHQKTLYNTPVKEYAQSLKDYYRRVMNRELNLDAPKTYTEKLNWLKLYDSTPLKARLADKFAVRDYVADKIGNDKLKPLLGVWDSFDEINFDKLPNRFVLKCNHGSGMNIIVRDKNQLDLREAREKINAWLASDYGAIYLELHYSLIRRKIIAEQYIDEVETGELYDYKIHCFNGEPNMIQVLQTQNLANLGNRAAHQGFYDVSWKNLGAMFEDAPLFPNLLPKPDHLEEMLNYARILCEPFAYSRADFYEIRGKVFFAEMTFYSDAGFMRYKKSWTYERDLEVGALINLNR